MFFFPGLIQWQQLWNILTYIIFNQINIHLHTYMCKTISLRINQKCLNAIIGVIVYCTKSSTMLLRQCLGSYNTAQTRKLYIMYCKSIIEVNFKFSWRKKKLRWKQMSLLAQLPCAYHFVFKEEEMLLNTFEQIS